MAGHVWPAQLGFQGGKGLATVMGAVLVMDFRLGLVLSNGEFGERLVDQARRMGLAFETLTVEWGRVIDRGMIETALARDRGTDWLWAVHCETSTGVLNDLETLKEV